MTAGVPAASARRVLLTGATGYVGGVFTMDRYKEAIAPDARNSQPNGSVFIGDKGVMTTGTYGEMTRLLPVAEKMADYKFPDPRLTRSPGHYGDWIRACKGGDPACSNFNNAVPFVEWMLLGVISLRVPGKLEWDAVKGRFSKAGRILKGKARRQFRLSAGLFYFCRIVQRREFCCSRITWGCQRSLSMWPGER